MESKKILIPLILALLIIASDFFYISAYTKFFKLGNRVAIEATTGKPRGVFLKRDLEGWTGIAFVNPEDRIVNVSLKAIGYNG